MQKTPVDDFIFLMAHSQEYLFDIFLLCSHYDGHVLGWMLGTLKKGDTMSFNPIWESNPKYFKHLVGSPPAH